MVGADGADSVMTPIKIDRGTPARVDRGGQYIKRVYLNNNKVPLYLRGPIPAEFIQQADKLGGTALLVGLAVWHYRSLNKASTFPLSYRAIAKFTRASLSRNRRGLVSLIEAGLIDAEVRTGKSHIITIPEKWRIGK